MVHLYRFKQNLDWNLLKHFDEIVAAGGLSKATRSSNLKQPALSLALQRLEEHLGAKLCDRGPTGFSLTREGEAVAAFCTKIAAFVALLPEHMATSAIQLRGQVQLQLVSALQNRRLDAALQRFSKRFPMVEISIRISPSWDELVNRLLRSEIDAGIGPISSRHNALSYDFLFNERQQIFCATDHHLSGQAIRDVTVLGVEPFVIKNPSEPEEILRYRLRHGLGQHVVARADHVDEVRRLVKLGIGIGFLPSGVAADDVERGRLWPLIKRDKEPSIPMYLVTNPSAPPHLARDMLLDELKFDNE